MYRIIARAPYERTSYAEPCEVVSVFRTGILTPLYALKLASLEAAKDYNYDVDFEVRDHNGRVVSWRDFDAKSHVHAYRMNRDYGIDADCPW